MSFRPFPDVMSMLDAGAFNDACGRELDSVVQHVLQTGRAGALTIKIEIKLARPGALNFLPSVGSKVTNTRPDATLLWTTDDGVITQDNPRQQKLDLRGVDLETGEIREVPAAAPSDLRTAT